MIERKPWIATVDVAAMQQLREFVTAQALTRFLVVADGNTWRAQGEEVASTLKTVPNADVKVLVLSGDEVVAGAEQVYQVLIALDDDREYGARTLVSVGSGTVTDIVRFVAHRSGREFISIPTAPSVDAYVSVGAPMIVNGVKVTYNTMAPIAVFADPRTLAAAPRPMIAAGFGDMIAKFTAVADFRLAHLIRGEMFDPVIADRMLATAQACANNVDAIGAATEEGVTVLLQSLYDSGWCMVDFGNSRPASGTEHHYSHFWEMMLLQQGRPPVLHGAKTGVGTVMGARLYARVRSTSRADVADLLEGIPLPDTAREQDRIRSQFGGLADELIAEQQPFIAPTPEEWEERKRTLLENWDAVQTIAATVPSPETIAHWLEIVGGPTTTAELGFTAEEETSAQEYAHYLRDRFTVRKLVAMLGI